MSPMKQTWKTAERCPCAMGSSSRDRWLVRFRRATGGSCLTRKCRRRRSSPLGYLSRMSRSCTGLRALRNRRNVQHAGSRCCGFVGKKCGLEPKTILARRHCLIDGKSEHLRVLEGTWIGSRVVPREEASVMCQSGAQGCTGAENHLECDNDMGTMKALL